jgi:hypothetical protein
VKYFNAITILFASDNFNLSVKTLAQLTVVSAPTNSKAAVTFCFIIFMPKKSFFYQNIDSKLWRVGKLCISNQIMTKK